ncbi:YCF48-related protein [Aquiflexum sp. TKW24L]|uniref:YCF48-related protein n=1 Tax=Aquiflexum sp. TKW24L TaxID=2942212 RepID=UPI0020C0E779|nr:YCF48-related protein [Aquiflexum sp. TKW24L]MCL6259177.1 YCF48-related protein [Aquiflexum sp. TKW24L]
MTKRILTLLIFILIHSFGYSQTWKRVGGRGNQLTDISWATEETGYVSGNQLILKTIDGGLSWVEQEAPTKTRMWGVDFFDENLGLMVGEKGEVFRTSNGGSNWVSINTGTSNTLRSVKFLTQTRAYAVGDGGEVYRSTNGGQSWAKQSVGTTVDLKRLYFANQDTGYVATADGKIVRTFNSGNNWSIQNTGQSNPLNDIYFSSGKTGFSVGQSGLILKTADAGTTWTTVTSGTERNLTAMSFNRSNPNLGVILGENGTVLRTTNGGITFDGINISNIETYFGASFRKTSNVIFAVGTNGTIISSVNSGANWTVRQTGLDVNYKATQFRTATLGYIVGERGLFLVTSNGGTTLTNRSRPVSGTFHDLAFTTNAFGYIVGDNGVALRTGNSGANWTSLNPPIDNTIYGLHFFANASGYAVGENGFMARTIDSGVNWEKISVSGTSETLRELIFFDNLAGVVIGQNGFLARTEDGVQWQKVTVPTSEDLIDMDILDPNSAVVVGKNGTVLKTSDRGISWTKITLSETKNLAAVDFLDESIGFVAGEKGLMLMTRDGGLTWTVLPTGTFQDFSGISFGDLSSGFAVGENGSLFNYSCQVPETPTVIFGESNICISQQVYQVQNTDADAVFEWRVDGGTILEGQGTSRITVRWDASGRNAVLVRGTNNCGNGGTMGLEVLVSTTPRNITEIQGEGVVCFENFEEYQVNDVPGTIFIWELTGGMITEGQGTSKVKVQWTKGGQNELKIKPTNPCGEGTFFSKAIQVISPPSQTSEIIGPDRVGLTEEVYEVTNVPDVNFQWQISNNAARIISGQGTNKITVMWEKQGDFTITVKGMNSCNSGPETSLKVNVNFITSIGKEPSSGKTNVYPNPSQGDVWVSFAGIIGVNQVKVSDIMGKEIQEVKPELGVDMVVFNNLPKGLYFVTVRSREKEYKHKLLVR